MIDVIFPCKVVNSMDNGIDYVKDSNPEMQAYTLYNSRRQNVHVQKTILQRIRDERFASSPREKAQGVKRLQALGVGAQLPLCMP